MGKNVEIKNPESPMSDRQSYCIYSLTGVDVREIDMTKQQASDVIDLINDRKAYHARLQMADAGGRVAKEDVHKASRDNPKPRGYATAMKNLAVDKSVDKSVDKPKPKTKGKKKADAKITGLEKVDFTNPDVIRVMEAFGLQKVAANG